jgi:hypothetical protein
MRALAVAGFILLFAAALPAQARSVSSSRLAGQIVAGAIAAPTGFAIGYTVGSGFRPHGSSNTGVALGFVGALLGPPTAVRAIGTADVPGSYGRAIAGTAAGYAAGYAIFKASQTIPWSPLRKALWVASALMPGAGAALAYNSGRN